jgi:hypothetical protein
MEHTREGQVLNVRLSMSHDHYKFFSCGMPEHWTLETDRKESQVESREKNRNSIAK